MATFRLGRWLASILASGVAFGPRERARARRGNRRWRFVPVLERLESRLAPATSITVSTGATAGIFLNLVGGIETYTPDPAAAASNVNNGDIAAFLNAGTPVAIDASLGTITVTASVAQTVGSPVNFTLDANGTVSEQGSGAIGGVRLITASAGGTTLTGANQVTSFNATNTTGGNVSLTDAAAGLSVTGLSQSSGNASISNSSGSITVSGASSASSGTLGLTATGATSDITLAANVGGTTVTLSAGRNIPVNVNLTVTGALTIAAGAFNANAHNVTVSGLTTLSAGSYAAGSGTQNFSGGLTISGGTFSGSTGTVNTNGVTLSSGTLTAPSGPFNDSGNWTAAGGTFTPGAGTVTLNGTGQTISGSTTFNNLTKSVASADTLTFAAGSTQTITGTLTLNGAAGQLLKLRSSTAGTQWKINPTGTLAVSFVDVQDSNNLNGAPIKPPSSVDSGNNTNWFAATLDITSGSLTYTGAVPNAALSIVAAGGNYTFTVSAGAISLTGGSIAAGWKGNGTTTVTGPTSSVTNNFIVNQANSGASITTSGTISVPGNVTITAGGNLVVDALSGTAVSLTSTGAVTSAGLNPVQASSSLSLTSATGITLFTSTPSLEASNNDSGNISITQVTSPAEPLTIAVGVFNLSDGTVAITNLGSTIEVSGVGITNRGAITLAATGLTLNAQINSATAQTTLENSVANTPFDVGTKTAGTIGLTQTELDEVTAGVLQIGSSTAGTINVSSAIGRLKGTKILTLINNAAITEGTSGSLGSLGLGISSTGPVTLTGANGVLVMAASTTNAFSFNNGSNDLAVAVVDTFTGITTINSDITLNADSLTIYNPVAAGTGNVLLTAGTRDVVSNTIITAGKLTVSAATDVSLTGANAVATLGGSAATSGNFTFNDSQNLTVAGITAGGGISLTAGGSGSDLILAANLTSGPAAAVTLNANRNVTVNSDLTFAGALNLTGGALNANTHKLTVAGLATLSGGSYAASTGAQSFNGGLTIAGAAFTGSTGTVTAGNVTLTSGSLTAPKATGAFNVSGNFTNNGGTFTANGGTVTFNGSAAQTLGGTAVTTFNHLAVNSSATLTLAAGASPIVSGNFSIQAGSFSAGANSLSVDGNFVNTVGTAGFNGGTGTVILGGTGQSISGSTTFNNLSKTVASADTLTFAAGSTQTIAGSLTLQGSSGQLLKLRSSTSGMQWKINPSGGRSVSFVDVQDSNNINTTAIAAASSVNSGNNINWNFLAAPAITSANAATFTVGTPGSFTVAAAGFPAPTFTMTAGALPLGLSVSSDGVLGGTAVTPGNYTITVSAANGVGAATVQTLTVNVQQPIIVTASSPGSPSMVNVTDNTGSPLFQLTPFGSSFTGGVGTAVVDVNGEPDIIAAAGLGGAPVVAVYSGTTGAMLNEFFAFAPQFTGGLSVAAGNLNGDAIFAIGAGPGGGPVVNVYNAADDSPRFTFYADAPSFTGGVRLAIGPVSGDGTLAIIAGDGPGGSHVQVVDDATAQIFYSFNAFAPGFTGGVYVAAGDVNRDGHADIIVGAGAGGGTAVQVVSGLDGSTLFDFFAYDPSLAAGVRVASVDVNADGYADIITSAGQGPATNLQAFSGIDLSNLDEFFANDPLFGPVLFNNGA